MSDMAVSYARRPISVEDYHRMADAGIFAPDERVELLDGELIVVPPMNSPHGGGITGINALLAHQFYGRALVRVGLPVIVDDYSEPEPDFALVGMEENEWRDRHPVASDVLLLIEVSDTSRGFDLKQKAHVYARASIPEYWVVDVVDQRLFVQRNPVAGRYATTQVLRPGERIASLAFPADELEVTAMTGRPAASNG